MRSLSSTLDLKNGILFAATRTEAPVLGLRMTRAPRLRVPKLPNPRSLTLSPACMARTDAFQHQVQNGCAFLQRDSDSTGNLFNDRGPSQSGHHFSSVLPLSLGHGVAGGRRVTAITSLQRPVKLQ